MKTFSIKTSLAAGLAHRLDTLDAQVVIDACGPDAIRSIRANQGIVQKIRLSNAPFEAAIAETEAKKREVFERLQAEYKAAGEGMAPEESAKLGRELTARFNAEAAEIQKGSKANPDELIRVSLSDEDYDKVLMPVFAKTAQLWDVEGNGGGQKLFVEVADALENVIHE